MRSDSKAFAQAAGSRRGAGPTLLALLTALAVLYLPAASAQAAVVTDRPLLESFDGSDTTAGRFLGDEGLAINQATGDVYVVDFDLGVIKRSVIDKFDAGGEAQPFEATGKSSLEIPSGGDIAVDNSSANPGRIYLSGGLAFSPAGEFLCKLDPFQGPGVAVDKEGHLWVGHENAKKVKEFANSGCPPAEVPSGGFEPQAEPARLDLDSEGNVYMLRETGGGHFRVDKYVGGAPSAIIDPLNSADVAVDQSSPSGHIFTVHASFSETFDEYDSSGALVGHFGKGVVSNAFSIAHSNYDPPGPEGPDRVYVADASGHKVHIFGPVTTGTVPDVTIEATDEISVSKAKFHGKANPQSVPNACFFEWKEGTASTSWGEAESSPPQPLPEDSADHPVSFDAVHLKGNTTYQVRLVCLNTANGLRAVSSPATFKTLQAASPPTVTIEPITAVGTTSAVLHGSVNPKEDFGTTYRFQLSTDPACASGFVNRPTKPLESEANSAVPVEEEASGLLPNQHYCVRLSATNGVGSAAKPEPPEPPVEFNTLPIPPDEVETAFVAPRLDTSARLNARVNPEGADLTYRFEWSEDGVSWAALPDREDKSLAREQIVVSDELTNLEPVTTYHYRFSAENSAGAASPQGGEKTFTTRTAAEVHPPSPCPNEEVRQAQHSDSYLGGCRGIELVNSPDKGTQHVHAELGLGTSPLRADGEVAIWNVFAGAPGGNSGAGATFLAKRTGASESAPNGWDSHSLIPPGEKQIGEAETGGYFPMAATPGFSAFVFSAGTTALSRGRTLVRLDADQNQTLLKQYTNELFGGGVDLSDDGAHVLYVDKDPPHQLEEIGSGAPEPVSVMPDGLPENLPENECGLDFEASNRSFVGGGSDAAAAKQWRPGYHMIATTDASRVYFQAKPNADERPPGQTCEAALYGIYERNRETGEATTLIDPGTGDVSPQFIRATPGGRAAYFLTASELDPADTNSHGDVYRWSEETSESNCLTCVIPDADVTFKESGVSAGGVLVSDNFSHIYFESTRQLVPSKGKAGEGNVYVLSDGEIRFVADPDNGNNGSLGRGTAELSADGNVLLLKTRGLASLTSDKVAPNQTQLYRYDDRDRSIECVSCRRGGLTTRAIAPDITTRDFQMSADGDTIAFPTPEALVPPDVNRGIDVYAWRDGVVGLFTDGVSSFPESLLATPRVYAVDADGSDVLFSLVDPGLTGFERDGFANLYDARVDGGFIPPNPPAHCTEDSCQGPLLPAPALERAASAGLAGRGNPPGGARRPPCAKGKVRRHGRCVRRHGRKHRRHGCKHHRHGCKRTRANRGSTP